jgi:threonine synthase
MKFVSTRGQLTKFSLSEAIQTGLAPDGGLFVPETLPEFSVDDFQHLHTFPEIAARALEPFFEDDLLKPHLVTICDQAFNFEIVFRDLPHHTSVLELFHGPTSAFKDVGARFLAEALSHISGIQPQTILVATSGDTGGAVASAFYLRPHFDVVILFPKNGVSARQRQQLTCFGENIHAFEVDGNFDLCQKLVKAALVNANLQKIKKLSSANSINIGRLLPQMTYYVFASILHFRKNYQPISLIIPSGNAGNVFAAILAKQMGLPIARIGLATNANRVIPDYFDSGHYSPRPSIPTLANAMDVGNPSNFERILFMKNLGLLNLTADYFSISVSDHSIRQVIAQGEERYGEIWCPHTATAIYAREQQDLSHAYTVVATAHPAKFETVVEPLIQHSVQIPPSLQKLLSRPVQVTELSGDPDEFFSTVKSLA